MALYCYVASFFHYYYSFVWCRLCTTSSPINLKQNKLSILCVWKVDTINEYTDFYWSSVELCPVAPIKNLTLPYFQYQAKSPLFLSLSSFSLFKKEFGSFICFISPMSVYHNCFITETKQFLSNFWCYSLWKSACLLFVL